MSQDPQAGTSPTSGDPVTSPDPPGADLVKSESPVATAPEWVAPMIRKTIWRIVWVIIVMTVLLIAVTRARSLVSMLVISLFFGIAMDPAVTYLSRRFGWRRGAATGLVFAGLSLAVIVTLVFLIPGLVDATSQMGAKVPDWINSIESTFGINIDDGKSPDQVQNDIQAGAQKWLSDNAQQVLGAGSNFLSLLFQFFTVAMFTFYIAAGAPKLQNTMLRQLPPARQQRAGWAWDTAIVQTGGYFYSRILLMVINGSLFFIVMLLVGVNWSIALPLSIFEGFVAEFIPSIGTYIGAAIPVIVTLALVGLVPALILVVWTIIYQQLENYLLSPKISAHTMELNGAVAFGAAMAGGAIAGPMGAFMALPIAAMITAFIKQYVRHYPLVYHSTYNQDPDDDGPTDQPVAEPAKGTS
jgi:predicted PurR-regulated permease PerM